MNQKVGSSPAERRSKILQTVEKRRFPGLKESELLEQ